MKRLSVSNQKMSAARKTIYQTGATMKRILVLCFLATGLVCYFANASYAAFMTYSSRPVFEAASGPLALEGFEALSPNLQTGPRTLSFDLFDVVYTGSGWFGTSDAYDGNNPVNIGPISGTMYLRADFHGSAQSLIFELDYPVTEFGIGIKDIEFSELGRLNFSTSNGEAGTAAVIASSGAVQYFGIVSDTAFSTITFSPQSTIPYSADDLVIFDDVLMTAVPEPSVFILLCGLMGLGIIRRR